MRSSLGRVQARLTTPTKAINWHQVKRDLVPKAPEGPKAEGLSSGMEHRAPSLRLGPQLLVNTPWINPVKARIQKTIPN